MGFVQEWTTPADTGAATSKTATGTVTTAGNLLLLRILVRATVTPEVVTVTDSAGNTWSQIAAAGDLALWSCPNASAITSVTVSWGESVAAVIRLSEWSGVGALLDAKSAVLTGGNGGLSPTVTPTAVGQLLFGAGGCRNSSRTWVASPSGMSPTPLLSLQANQITMLGGYTFSEGSDPVAYGWTRSAGTASDLYVITALFAVAGPSLEELPPAAVSGWTTVEGDNRLAALSDDNDSTYVATGENPVAETLTVTLPALVTPTADLQMPVRLSSTGGTVTLVPGLYDPQTAAWINLDPIEVSGVVADYMLVWPLADLAAITGPQWAAGIQVRLVADVEV